jgi:hypothetical protein
MTCVGVFFFPLFRFLVKNVTFKKFPLLPSSGNTMKHLLDGADLYLWTGEIFVKWSEASVTSPSCPFVCLPIA